MIEGRAVGDLFGPLLRHEEELHLARVSLPARELLARTLRNVGDDVVRHKWATSRIRLRSVPGV